MTAYRFFWYYFWIAPHVLQLAVVNVMIGRKIYREFPMFFLYSCFEVVQFATLFIMSRWDAITPAQFAGTYWIGMAVSTALRFGIIQEIFAHVFKNYAALEHLGRMLFRWATAVLLLVGVIAAAYAPAESGRLYYSLVVIDRSVSIVQCGLLFFLFVFAGYFSISLRQYGFGIALGLGIFASVELVSAAVRTSVSTTIGTDVLSFVTMGTYHCCVLIWLFYLLAPQTERVAGELPSHEIEQWNMELRRLIRQ
jgi:hypothetical protein